MPVYDQLNVIFGGHNDICADDGLGSQPRDGGRADVIDSPRDAGDHGPDMRADLLEPAGPLRVVIADDDLAGEDQP